MVSYPFVALFVLVVLKLLSTRYSRGLNRYNGPFLASFSDLWKCWYAYGHSTKKNDIYVDVHRKFGDVVRIGPNNLSFADPRALSEIYGTKGSQQKSKWYEITSMPQKGVKVKTILSSTNTKWHDQQRRLINSAFSLTSILKYESWVDDTIELFQHQIKDRYANKDGASGIIDLHKWIAFFTADVISNLTYGKRTGFLERGEDIEGIHEGVRLVFRPWLYLSRMPLLDHLTFKNPLLLWLQKRGMFLLENPLTRIVHNHFQERKQVWQSKRDQSTDGKTLSDHFLTAERDNAGKIEFRAEGMAFGMIVAGSETTAITLSSTFYFLLKNPQCYAKLQQEVDAVPAAQLSVGNNGNQKAAPVFSWATAQKLTYLDACICEAMRLHPVQRLPHDRAVPPGGMTICGHHVPAGTDVGVCSAVLHRRVEVFGEDVETYRPERWSEASAEQVQLMKNSMFTFSYGKYSCLGQNISKMEMYKFIPSVMRQFQVELVDPKSEWTLVPGAFAIPDGIMVKMRTRH